jgi:hypothetical protein
VALSGSRSFVLQREQQARAVLRAADHLLLVRGGLRVQRQLRGQLDVLAQPEAAQRRQVVRADHGQRLGLPLRGPAEAAVLVALEQQRLVRQQVALAHGLAHARRDVAQVLADHHALVALALQREHRQQVLQRVLDVGAALRPVQNRRISAITWSRRSAPQCRMLARSVSTKGW